TTAGSSPRRCSTCPIPPCCSPLPAAPAWTCPPPNVTRRSSHCPASPPAHYPRPKPLSPSASDIPGPLVTPYSQPRHNHPRKAGSRQQPPASSGVAGVNVCLTNASLVHRGRWIRSDSGGGLSQPTASLHSRALQVDHQ